jgi:hypothetical protein
MDDMAISDAMRILRYQHALMEQRPRFSDRLAARHPYWRNYDPRYYREVRRWKYHYIPF